MEISTSNYIITYTIGEDYCYVTRRKALSKENKHYITEQFKHELSDYEKEWILNPFVGTPGVNVSEVDGSPSELVRYIEFPNGSVSISDGVATITFSVSETDPIVGAIAGIVKADGAGNISLAVANTDYQSVPSEGAFADGDKTKLDGIEASATADQTGAEIKVAYEAEDDTNAFTDAEKTKLSGIEALADVTDVTNVTSAGALMDSEVTDLAGIKVLDTSTLQVKPAEGAFEDGDKTKLDGVEALADVTDSTNVNAVLVSPGPIGTTTPGLIRGEIDHIIQASTDTLTAAECSGTIISNYGQSAENTQTLPTAAEGLSGMITIATSGAGAFHLKAGASDKIYLDGTALDDGDKASLATPTLGDFFTFFSFLSGNSTWDWVVRTGEGILTDGGA